MAKFMVAILETMTQTVAVEAETWQEAVAAAYEEGTRGLCHQEAWEPDGNEQAYQVTDEDGNVVANADLGESVGELTAAG